MSRPGKFGSRQGVSVSTLLVVEQPELRVIDQVGGGDVGELGHLLRELAVFGNILQEGQYIERV